MDVAGCDALHPEPLRQPRELPVTGAIVTEKRTLQLDPEMVATEHVKQPPHRELIVDTAQRTSAQADEAPGMFEHRLQRHPRLGGRPGLVPRVRMSERQD